MLKGHVFKDQIFENQIFALFINTFLDGHNGVVNNYKNSMEISYSGSNITINSGAICIQGRFLEEDTCTTLDAGTNTLFCNLILEIDLDKENTELEFNQAYYKILTSESNYPNLTQDEIVDTNSGVYQYELAKFKTGLSGITNFVDERTFLDFDSIYDEIDRRIQEIEDGSIYALKEDVEEEFENLITVPIGGGLDFYGRTAPEKYLFADGSAISRTEYAELFAVIGTTYGAGDGSTTFNLPDKRERVSVGYKAGSTNGTSGATMGTLGAMGGEFKHALSSSENGKHNHGVTDNGHTHGITDPGHFHYTGVGSDGDKQQLIGPEFFIETHSYAQSSKSTTNIEIKSGKTGISIANSGNGVAHNNLQPYLVCNYIIRVK